MKNIFSLSLIFTLCFLMTSCVNDDEAAPIDYAYETVINTPTAADMQMNDALLIDVEFESKTGEAIHHINIRIYNLGDGVEIYNKPDEANVNEIDGMLQFQDMLMLTDGNGLEANSNWIMEVSVWGPEDREGEVVEMIQFRVLP